MKAVSVAASRRYDILIERGLLNRAGKLVRSVTNVGTVMLVSDDSVWPLYGETVQKSLEDTGVSVCQFVFPHGEGSKCAKTYLALLDALCENRLTRADAVVALGGGVVGDLTGFAASTYLRGIGFIQIPTTLLAMVDSSVGGKTAIDLPAGKNLAGAFYQPWLVLCDPDCLDSLPDEIFRDGCAEVIKYAVLGNAPFFDELKNTPPHAQLEHIIETCVRMKRDIVAQDEFDRGQRQLLNLGHTFGHGIEACSGFSVSWLCRRHRHGDDRAGGGAIWHLRGRNAGRGADAAAAVRPAGRLHVCGRADAWNNSARQKSLRRLDQFDRSDGCRTL